MSGAGVYVAGDFTSPTATFGPITLTNVSAGRGADVFVASLTDTGPASTFTWALQAGGTGNDGATSLAVVGTALYVGGTATPPAAFGAQSVSTAGTTAWVFWPRWRRPAGHGHGYDAEGHGSCFPTPPTAPPPCSCRHGTGQATLTVLDAWAGRCTPRTAAPGPALILDLAGLAPGLYAVRVAGGGNTATRRLVVE